MDQGYTRHYRKMWSNPLFEEKGKHFSRLEAGMDIINRLAAGIDRDGLKRGEFEASTRFLAKRWNWSKSKVERFMSDLQAGDDPVIKSLGHFAGQNK